MKEKGINKDGELEGINGKLFGSFDPEDEPWIGGAANRTITLGITGAPTDPDFLMDLDDPF